MNKLYDKIIWNNNTTPALNETNLNKMSKAIDDIDDRVVELAADVFVSIPQIQAYLDQAEDLYEAMVLLSQNPPYIGQNGNWWVWSTSAGAFVDSEIDASITVQIADISMLEPGATPYVTNTGTNTDPVFHLFIPRGQKGDPGQGGASSWSDLSNKPFNTIGDSLTTSDNALKVDTTFTQASERNNIASGETIPTILGKIKKWFADLKTVALTGSYNDLSDQPTIPDSRLLYETDDDFITEFYNSNNDSVPVHSSKPGDSGPRQITWANFKSALKTYFDTLYRPLKVTKQSVSSLPTTISNANITAAMEVPPGNLYLTNPSAHVGEWTFTTAAGSVTISGTISGTTDITLWLETPQ